MVGLVYSTYQQQLAVMAGYTVLQDGVTVNYDQNYLAILPSVINYAELRMQRDLDFLSTQVNNSSLTTSAGNNIFSVPLSSFIIMQTVEVLDLSGNSVPLLFVSKEFMQNVYGSGSTQGFPQYFAPYGADSTIAGITPANHLLILGPIPDQNYTVRLIGSIHAAPLSATNPQTFISTYLPDMFIMASMIYMSGFQRNFGRQSDDPQMAQSYEAQYKALLQGAMSEEGRKKYQAAAWSSYSPAAVASPTRG